MIVTGCVASQPSDRLAVECSVNRRSGWHTLLDAASEPPASRAGEGDVPPASASGADGRGGRCMGTSSTSGLSVPQAAANPERRGKLESTTRAILVERIRVILP